jgi:hypothetical protein
VQALLHRGRRLRYRLASPRRQEAVWGGSIDPPDPLQIHSSKEDFMSKLLTALVVALGLVGAPAFAASHAAPAPAKKEEPKKEEAKKDAAKPAAAAASAAPAKKEEAKKEEKKK